MNRPFVFRAFSAFLIFLLAAMPAFPQQGQRVQGASPVGSPPLGFPIYVAGFDGTNLQPLRLNGSGAFPTIVTTSTTTRSKANSQGLLGQNPSAGLPIDVFPFSFNGATWDANYVCNTTVPINMSSATTTQMIALSGTTIIAVCSFSATLGGTTPAIQLVAGTGTNCGTGTTSLTGPMPVTPGTPLTITPGPTAPIRAAAGQAVCVALTGTSPTAGGYITYSQF